MNIRSSTLTITTALTLLAGTTLLGCSKSSESTDAADNTASTSTDVTYTIAVIGKSNSNPPFLAAKTGAFDAASRLSESLEGVTVKINWQTPPVEDAQVQSQTVEQLVASGVDGIAISVSDANTLNGVLQDAVNKGVVVVTFDSDAPASGRMAYYGVDDKEAGRELMRQLGPMLDGNGTVAILTGNPAASNLAARVEGVREEAENFDGVNIKQVYSFMPETATEAVAKMQQVQITNPDINGWALVGGWPLYTNNALDGIHENAKVVSMDPLPLPIAYAQSGQVQVLVGQPYYGWGEKSVEMIVDKLHFDKSPESELVFANFDIVTTENAEEYLKNWDTWLKSD
jgi:ribose transport system substrate-binding protein